ncbi:MULTISPECIES: hypothetical protein [Variovorax]|jgi:hypothetical protein|uniref:hypothetical protein n=1 Tax=Variovorax sp. 3P27G3 TaxID=2502214 RepID=UPI0010F96DD7|nr:hypothetical protein [Variovorax sp. 3P27G3]
MSNQLFASILAAALSLGSAVSFAAAPDTGAPNQATPAKAQAEGGKTHYWMHPRLGLVKVDAAGRMLSGRSSTSDAAQATAQSGHPSTRVRRVETPVNPDKSL